jgi:diguanylate cyclase (GGDEF)-like protein/PAS domain S-box-containing protein
LSIELIPAAAQSILDSLIEEIAILDAKGVILAVNTAWRRFTARNGAFALDVAEGANYLQICDNAEGEDAVIAHRVAAGIRAIAARETNLFSMEYPCHSPTEQHWFCLRVTRLVDNGQLRIITAHEDITQRKLAITESEAKSRDILTAWESMTDAVVITDKKWSVNHVNANYCKITGKSRQDLIGMDIWSTHPDTIYDSIGYRECNRAMRDQVTVSYEEYYEPLRMWFEVHAYPSEVGLAIYIRDISTRKHAEEKLQKSQERLLFALNAGQLGMFDRNIDSGSFNDVTGICKSHYGVSEDVAMTFKDVIAAIHPDDRALVKDAVEDAIKNRHDYLCEYRTIWPDGSVHWLLANGKGMYTESGQPIANIGLTQDISERRSIEQEKQNLLVEAQERADKDPLTGLLNHRAFHNRLKAELARSNRDGSAGAVILLDLDNFKFFNDSYSHSAGDEVLRVVADRLAQTCRPYDILSRYGGDEFALILSNVGSITASEIEARLLSEIQHIYFTPPEGNDIPITISVGAALFSSDITSRHEVLKKATERVQWCKTGGEVETQAENIRSAVSERIKGFSMLTALVVAVDNKDRYTRRHSEGVMAYSLMIAVELGVPNEVQQTIAVAALIHDVGKIGIPDSILRKPGRLTPEEFDAIKMHPSMGLIMVKAVPGLEDTHDVVQYHHERWDGGGYPSGIAGANIPMTARIVAVADAFSAMTTDRPYHKAKAFQEALVVLLDGAGSQWDADCVAAFNASICRRMALDAAA